MPLPTHPLQTLSGSVRYRLLVLVLAPLLVILPLALTAWSLWLEDYLNQQLLYRVNADLNVAQRSLDDLQQTYLQALRRIDADRAWRRLIDNGDREAARQRLRALQSAEDLDFLRLLPAHGGDARSRAGALLEQALDGRAVAGLEVLDRERLEELAPGLAGRADIPLVSTPQARPDPRDAERRGMLLRALLPVRDAEGRVLGLLDGGVLLNRRHTLVDTLRNLVYGPGSLPGDSIGTVTLFLDDVRIATNVTDRQGKRAIGTRVSAAVSERVMGRGLPWSDRAFVVDQWHIAAYKPLQDAAGRRIGMLYAGFTEAPFRNHMQLSRVTVLAGVLLFSLFAGLAVVRGAGAIFRPLETMTAVVSANRQGRSQRVGAIGGGRELEALGHELDRLLNRLDSAGRENHRLALVARHTHSAVLITGADARIQWVNPSFEQLTGYTLDEALGRHPGDFLQGSDTDPDAASLMRERMAARQQVRLDVQNYHKSGRPYWVSLEIQPVLDEQDRLTHYIAVETDITEQVAARQALEASRMEQQQTKEFLDAVLQNLPMAVRVKDLQSGNYLLWNRFAEKLFGLHGEQALGHSDSQLFPAPMAETLAQLDRKTLANDGLTVEPELRLQRADGGTRLVHSRQIPIRDAAGQAVALLGMSEDIGERKRIDAALRERTRDLHRANAELQRIARLKDDFFANMSHELRTPLNAILALAEILQEEAYGPLTEKQAKGLTTIGNSGRHLLSLISDILDLSKIDAERMQLQAADIPVEKVCRESLDLIEDLARRQGIEPRLELPAPDLLLRADELRLRQILVNLLSNAVKVTPEGRSIGLRVEPTGDELCFEVWDQGPGIPPEQRQHLFQPFVQLHNGQDPAREGSGLGLALVQKLTDLHHGRVELLSDGDGSRFRIHLPWHGRRLADQSPVTATGPEPTAAPGATDADGPLILLADDNPQNVEMLQDYLETLGYRVATAADGQQALYQYRLLQPPLILMDIHMPVVDGLEAIRRIRADTTTRRPFIAAVTALAMKGDRERCLNAGADAYLTKPVRLRELAECLRQATEPAAGTTAPAAS